MVIIILCKIRATNCLNEKMPVHSIMAQGSETHRVGIIEPHNTATKSNGNKEF